MNKYYILLELSPGATKEEIRKAYRRLSKKYHPDMNGGSKLAEEKFKEVNEAYEALYYDDHFDDYESSFDSDYDKKSDESGYDKHRHEEPVHKGYARAPSMDFSTVRSIIVIIVATIRLMASCAESSSYSSPRIVTYPGPAPDITELEHPFSELTADSVFYKSTMKPEDNQ